MIRPEMMLLLLRREARETWTRGLFCNLATLRQSYDENPHWDHCNYCEFGPLDNSGSCVRKAQALLQKLEDN